VDLAELVQQSFAGPPSGGAWNREHLVATMSFVQAEAEVELNPRVATALFALGVELVAQGGSGTPHVLVDQDAAGRYRVQIAPSNRRDGEDLILIARGVIEPTLVCLRAVASISGVTLAWDEAAASLCFAFPEQAKPRKAEEVG
jgi:hypothetical protein